ncbi:cilia- and flagella-associated protein 299-like [Musca domestica]|uniref:Cilia- and flagella-associated protein 299 n=1 Tax=Musca domestica TaxID=7370 RepID=A0ABM3V8F7_MUSDO|nr:cilia- and flagella-associated protein 299-like [Musca domestica]
MTGTIAQDMFLLDCPGYEDYLDTFVTRSDIRFIRNVRFCRMLVELGYRSPTDIYTPEQFQQHKAAVQESLWPIKKSTIFFSDGMKSQDPVLIEMANRERPNAQKMISTIIFIKHRLKTGFEISGYIDYEQSLHQANLQEENCTDWAAIFGERLKLRPKTTDLSFFDWHKGLVLYNESDNYLVQHDVHYGLIFMHKGDHKKVCVDIDKPEYSKNCTRSMHFSERYGHVVFYDHVIRKKI